VKSALNVLVSAIAACGVGAPAVAHAQAASTTTRVPSSVSSSPFLGSVPAATATPETIRLTFGDAIERALERNLGLLLAEHETERAQGGRWLALSALLPDITGSLRESRQITNLAAFGFPLPAGIPPVVGPFNVFDARISVEQPVLDLRATNQLKAERHTIAAADHSYRSARDLVVLATANAYLQALSASARLQTTQAQLATAEALETLANDLKAGGLVAGIDVLRARLQTSTERQRVTGTRNDAEKAKLQLARVVGLPTGQGFTLVEELPDVPDPDTSLETAVEQAMRTRPDYLAALERVHAAEAVRQAAVSEAMPSVHVHADYGALGLAPSNAERTYTLAGTLEVPIFQAGRRRGQIQQADAALRSRQAEAGDLKANIYYEVRTALLDLSATREQMTVATEARDLAAQQLTQARDRLAAGVANTIEVVQAQEAVSLASEQYIAALYGFNLSKAVLARSVGTAEAAARQYIGGVR
jgi:outer membrane protein TolC